MPIEEDPKIGAIYEDPDGLAFKVMAVDEDVGTIAISCADGTVGEIDADAWYEMDLRRLKFSAGWPGGPVPANDEDEDEEEQGRLGRPDGAEDDGEEEEEEEE